MTRLLTYPLAAIALVTGGVSLLAWRVACPVPPEERMYGARPSVRAMVRFHFRRRADSRHPTASPA